MRLKTAVVILNWNGKHFLEKFLPNVITHSPKNSVFVADNCSTDDSVSFVEKNFPEVNVILNKENGGFAKGYNDALKHVNAEYFVLLNSDVDVSSGWIEPIISYMDNHPNIAACQPKILAYNQKTYFEYAGASGGYIDVLGYPFCRGRIFDVCEQDVGQYNDIKEVFWASGACMFVRADVFHELGGFDEDFFAHMEEIDLCWRMQNTGHHIAVVPQSTVYHVGGGTLNKSNPKKTFLNFRNSLMTIVKNDSSGILFFKIVLRLILDGLAGILFLMRGNGSDCFAIIKAHFAFYFSISKSLQKRAVLKKATHYKPNKKSIYKGKIVLDYYLKKKKAFSELAQ